MNSSLNGKGFRFTKVLSVAALAGLTFSFGVNSANADTLVDVVSATDGERFYEMFADENVEVDLGVMGGANSSLTIEGSGYSVNGQAHSGITVQNGQVLNISGVDGSNSSDELAGAGFSGFSKDESMTRSSGRGNFEGGAVLRVLQGATVNFSGTNSISNNVYTSLLTANASSSSTNVTAEATGGIISNAGNISDISADFLNNYVKISGKRTKGRPNSYLYGGIIGNKGVIGNIAGNFENNTVESNSGNYIYIRVYGGLISNEAATSNSSSSIGNISGQIKNNNITPSTVYGGILANRSQNSGSRATIGNIESDIIGNNSTGNLIYNYSYQYGYSSIGNITGLIKENNTSGSLLYNYAEKYSTSNLGYISASIVENNVSSNRILGGILSNEVREGSSITVNGLGSIVNNKILGQHGINGGIIHNIAGTKSDNRIVIGDTTGSISGNVVQNTGRDSYGGNSIVGGLIFNRLQEGDTSNSSISMGDILGGISDNTIIASGGDYASISGGLIYNDCRSSEANIYIGEISGGIINNKINAGGRVNGGLINNIIYYVGKEQDITIKGITGGVLGNEITTSSNDFLSIAGGLIYNGISSGIDDNYNSGNIGYIDGGISSNKITTQGGVFGGLISNGRTDGLNTIGHISGGILNNDVTAKEYVYGGVDI